MPQSQPATPPPSGPPADTGTLVQLGVEEPDPTPSPDPPAPPQYEEGIA